MNTFQRYLAEEFVEDYQEGRMSRQQALKLIASVLGSLTVAQTFLAACAPPPEPAATATPIGAAPTGTTSPTNTAAAATSTAAPTEATESLATSEASSPTAPAAGTVSPDDAAVQGGETTFPGEDGATLTGYLARPADAGPAPIILVCHENRGLTDHIRDVTRRLAKAGYVALAVDLLSRQGGSAAVGSDNVPGALGNIDPGQFVADFRSGWRYLAAQTDVLGDRVGMVGFCFGGGVTWRVAVGVPELRAAVPFYGPHPDVAEVPAINAAVLGIYGGLDQRINQGIPAIEAAMLAEGKIYEKRVYDGADHAFHNDTGTRYNADAARDAWALTLDWFARYVRS